jgi:Lon protease-like protein
VTRLDDGDAQLQHALVALPIFPLPGTVFFPHTLLPLHVFEPRYRQLAEDVLRSHLHIGIVCIDDARSDVAVRGVARVSGVGRVVHHERLADGRYHMLLQGIARAELVEELPAAGLLYRRCSARELGAALCSDEDELAEARTLRQCYARVLEMCPDTKDLLGDLPLRVHEPRVLADVVCAAILEGVAARQAALEEGSVARRLQCANDALALLMLRDLATESGGMH